MLLFLIQDCFRLVSLQLGLLVEMATHLIFVELLHHLPTTVATPLPIRLVRPRLGHEAVDTEDERETCAGTWPTAERSQPERIKPLP